MQYLYNMLVSSITRITSYWYSFYHASNTCRLARTDHSGLHKTFKSLQWRHNGRDDISNHQPHDCLLNRLFNAQIKETSKLCVTGLCEENSPVTGEFPTQRPVTRKMFPFDDVIMQWWPLSTDTHAPSPGKLVRSWCLFGAKSFLNKFISIYLQLDPSTQTSNTFEQHATE